jgi:hypothetical protein
MIPRHDGRGAVGAPAASSRDIAERRCPTDSIPAAAVPTPDGIVGEYLAALRQMTAADARALIAQGIPVRAVALVCPVPVRIAIDVAGDLYWPDPDGRPAWALPVCAADPIDPRRTETADPAAVVGTGPIIDLVAFSPAAPSRWALRRGAAMVLGAIEPQYLDPPPVPIHRDVTDWLRAGCRGLVLLTRDPHEAGCILRECQTIEAEDAGHAAELRRLVLLPPYCDTRVTVRPVPRRAA